MLGHTQSLDLVKASQISLVLQAHLESGDMKAPSKKTLAWRIRVIRVKLEIALTRLRDGLRRRLTGGTDLLLLVVLYPLLAGILIWYWPGLHVPNVDAANPHALYLLSSIAQSLAAVMAIVFTITLVIAQLASNHSPRMLASFFDAPTIAYMLFFIISLLLPLWLIAEADEFAARLSLCLAATSILLLVPYFLSFREKLRPERLLLSLSEESIKGLKADPTKEPEAVQVIHDCAIMALARKDYDTFNKGVEALARLSLEACSWKFSDLRRKPSSALYQTAHGIRLIRRICNLGALTLDDHQAPLRVTEILGDLGTQAIDRGERTARFVLGEVLSGLKEICLKAAEKNLDNLLDGVVRVVVRTCLKAAEENVLLSPDIEHILDGTEGSGGFPWEITETLQSMVVRLDQMGKKDTAKKVVLCLLEMGARATLKDNVCLRNAVNGSLQDVGQEAGTKLIELGCEELEEGLDQEYKDRAFDANHSWSLKEFEDGHSPYYSRQAFEHDQDYLQFQREQAEKMLPAFKAFRDLYQKTLRER